METDQFGENKEELGVNHAARSYDRDGTRQGVDQPSHTERAITAYRISSQMPWGNQKRRDLNI